MKITLAFFIIFILLPVLTIRWQYVLCKQNSKHTLVIPTITAILTLFTGFYSLTIAGITFYMHYKNKGNKKEKVSEMTKMNIDDL